MNYYKRHIGDYAKDTRFLSTYQHGVYALFLDWYYSNEKPIPMALAYRIVQARSGPERRAVDEVLSAFFDVTKGDGLAHNKRADLDIAKYRIKGAANSLIAQEMWDAKRMQDASQTHDERYANDIPSHKPLATSHEKAKTPVVPKGDDSAAVLSAYHSALPKCQQIAVLNPKRKRRIADAVKLARQICSGQGWPYVPDDFWQAYFAECRNDPWLRGEVANPNNPRWVQNLDVLLAEDRFAEIMDKAIAAMRADA